MAHHQFRKTRQLAAAAVLGVVMLGVVACSSDEPASAPAMIVDGAAMAAPTEPASDGGFGDAEPASPSKAGAPSKAAEAPNEQTDPENGKPATVTLPLDGRDVIRTASMEVGLTLGPEITYDSPSGDIEKAKRASVSEAAARARAAAVAAGGYIGASEQAGDTVTLTIRVPRAGYDNFLSSVRGLGEVTSATESTQDVTEAVADVQSRIKTMRASVERVRAMLGTATDIGDVVQLESELSSREADLESLLAQQASMADQVAFSTISVMFTADIADAPAEDVVEVLPEPEATGFLGGLQDGWNAMKGFLVWLGTVLGALLPFLPIIAAVVLLGWIWRRRLVRAKAAYQAEYLSMQEQMRAQAEAARAQAQAANAPQPVAAP